MIAVVRMKAQKRSEKVWDYIVTHLEELQGKLQPQGRLLYLSRRAKHERVSLFVHVTDPDLLGSFIADDLGKIEDLTGCWVLDLLKPLFFPLPKDTGNMKRYVVTLRVLPAQIGEIYERLSRPELPSGMMMAYLALTCHLYGDALQFSALAEDEEQLNAFIAEQINTLPGVLHTTVNDVETTKPLVSYDEWREYSEEHSLVPTWDEKLMVQQFST